MKKPKKTAKKAIKGFDTRNMPMMRANLNVRDNSFDAANNTIEIIWSAGADVTRYDWNVGDIIIEQLSMDAEHIRLERFKSGSANLLKDHRASVDNVIGGIEDAWLEGELGLARVKLSENPDHAGIVGDIKAGIIRAVSVGYVIHEMTLIEAREGAPNIYMAKDWEPFEASIVAVPADAGASVRSEQQEVLTACLIERATPTLEPTENVDMKTEEEKRLEAEAKKREAEAKTQRAAEIKAAEDKASEAGAVAERARLNEIETAVRDFGFDDTVRTEMQASGDGIDAVRANLQDMLAKRSKDAFKGRTEVHRDAEGDEAKRAVAMENALLARMNPTMKLDDHAREFRGLSLLEMGRDCIIGQGRNARGMDKGDVAFDMLGLNLRAGAMTTSDFVHILSNVANKQFAMLMGTVNPIWKQLARQTTLPDFKASNIVRLHGGVNFKKKLESGEYEHTTFSDSAASYSLTSYGRTFSFSPELIINDDLMAFLNTAQMIVSGSQRLQSNLFWDIFTSNPKLGDNKVIFATGTNTLAASGSIIDKDSVSDMREAMMAQKDTDKDGKAGDDELDLMPKFLIVPPKLMTHAEEFLTPITAVETGKVNNFAGKFELITVPRLGKSSNTAWYAMADPAAIESIRYAYLEGADDGLDVKTRTNWATDALDIKAKTDFAVTPIYRQGMYKNAGT